MEIKKLCCIEDAKNHIASTKPQSAFFNLFFKTFFELLLHILSICFAASTQHGLFSIGNTGGGIVAVAKVVD